jgi:photosystem II stability/assembly factor-like uncharacterized protein
MTIRPAAHLRRLLGIAAAMRWLCLEATAAAEEAWFLEGLSGVPVTALAAGGSEPEVLYAGSDSGRVFRSPDSGQSWLEVSAGLPEGPIRALAVHPGDARILYAGTVAGVFRSGDGGASWVASSAGMAGGAVHALAVDPGNPAVVWASADEPGPLHVYRTADGGAIWQSTIIRGPGFGTPSNFGFVRSLVIRPGSSRVYAGWHEIVFWTDDGGGMWNKFPDVNFEVMVVRLDPFDPALVYAGTMGRGVARSVDTAPWTFADEIGTATIAALEIDPGEPGLLYAAIRDGGVFRSRDEGQTWLELGAIALPPSALLVASGDGTLRAGTSGGVFRWGTPPAAVPRPNIVRARPRPPTVPIVPRP